MSGKVFEKLDGGFEEAHFVTVEEFWAKWWRSTALVGGVSVRELVLVANELIVSTVTALYKA